MDTMFHQVPGIVGRVAAALLCASLLLGAGDALACSCERPDRQLTDAEFRAWSFERAVDVVRGRILEVKATRTGLDGDYPIFTAKMNVVAAVKGNAPTGEIVLSTLPGVAFERADCGAAHLLLAGIVARTDLAVEVKKMPERPDEYWIDLCGYAELARASGGNTAPK